MRSVVALGVLALVAACYAPNAATGAPCSPSAPVCPAGQMCKPAVGGGYACTDGDGSGSGSGSIDAPFRPIDAMIDGAPAVRWKLLHSSETIGGPLGVTSTGAGHLMIVAIETGTNGPINNVTDDAGTSYVRVPNGSATDPMFALAVELWYAANTRAGATSITIDGGHASVVAWEVSGIATTAPIDAVAKVDNQPTSTSPYGALIATSVRGDFVVSVLIVANSIDNIVGTTFTNDHSTFGNGWAHLTDDNAAPGLYRAQWTQPTTGESCGVTAAFLPGS